MPCILLVTGLWRCGSSLLMQMLRAGGVEKVAGLPPMHEDLRTTRFDQFGSNPGGSHNWMRQYQGGAVKCLVPHIRRPPMHDDIIYHVVFLDRSPTSQCDSTRKWVRHERAVKIPFNRVMQNIRRNRFPAMQVARELAVNGMFFASTYESLKKTPEIMMSRLKAVFPELDTGRAIGALRNRETRCLPTMLELELAAEVLRNKE